MPTYEYRCPEGHEFERFFRKISDAQAELPCPECGKTAERIMSAGAGLVFKGSGFYLTDYGKNAHRKTGSESAPKSSDSGDKSGGDAGGDKTVSSVKPIDAKSSESSTKSSESKPSANGPSSSSSTKSDK